jgi:hypothetical protein
LVGHLLARNVDAQVVLAIAEIVNDTRFRPPLEGRDGHKDRGVDRGPRAQAARRRSAMTAIDQLAAAQNGHADPISAAQELTALLDLGSVGLEIRGARIVGRGGSASADLYLSNGATIDFASLRDFGKASVLMLEIAAATGATPAIKAAQAIRAVALLRSIADHQSVHDADDFARDWGASYLQEADVLDLDMNDQTQRWDAFVRLRANDPYAKRSAGEVTTIAGGSIVLRHESGTRYVRCGWFLSHVKLEESIGAVQLANRMERVGWRKRGKSGRIKAMRPSFGDVLAWSFYEVPVSWGDASDADPESTP